MGRRTQRAKLGVLVSFEPARIAPECLARAYEHVLPIQRRRAGPDSREEVNHGAAGKLRQAGQRSEHG